MEFYLYDIRIVIVDFDLDPIIKDSIFQAGKLHRLTAVRRNLRYLDHVGCSVYAARLVKVEISCCFVVYDFSIRVGIKQQ